MKWARERDLLVAQTMAFVQSVAGKKPEAQTRVERIELSPIDNIEKAERPIEIIKTPVGSPIIPSNFREEIQGRVAAFRAHQKRFDREREEYFNSVLTQARAAIGEPKAPPS